MRCDQCILVSPELSSLPADEIASRLSRCDECPMIQGSDACPPEITAVLVSKLRESASELRRQANKLRRAERALAELREEIARSDARMSKIEALHAWSSREIEAELRDKMDLVERQRAAMQAMSTPIIQVSDGVLVVPLIGEVDDRRVADLTARLLTEIKERRARYAIVELTGISILDEASLEQLLMVVRAVALLGAAVVVCGLRPEAARALSSLNVDVSCLRAERSLKEALRACRSA